MQERRIRRLIVVGIPAVAATAGVVIGIDYFANKGKRHILPGGAPTPTPTPTVGTVESEIARLSREIVQGEVIYLVQITQTKTGNPNLVVATDKGVFMSPDLGKSWVSLPTEGAIHFYPRASAETPSGEILYGTLFGEVFSASNNKVKKIAKIRDHDVDIAAIAVNPANGNHVLVGTHQAGIFQSLDSVKTLQKVPSWPSDINAATIQCIEFNREKPGQIFVGTMNLGLWTSDNNGNNWRILLSRENGGPNIINDVKISPQHGILLATGQGLAQSKDDGTSWEFPVRDIQVTNIALGDQSRVAFSTETEVWQSEDDLYHWTRMQIGRDIQKVVYSLATSPSDPNTLWVGTKSGLFVSTDRRALTLV